MGPRKRLPPLLGTRWYVNTTQDFLNSEEQGLDLRTTIGGGGGRYLLRSSSQHLALGGGVAWTNENYTDPTTPTKDSAEAYFGTEFMTEKLKITDFITRFTDYPSLTISTGTGWRTGSTLTSTSRETGISGSGSSTTTTASRSRGFRRTITDGRTRSASSSEDRCFQQLPALPRAAAAGVGGAPPAGRPIAVHAT